MDIYVDVLFVENLLINYIILLISNKILNKKIVSLKIFSGALIGTIYVIIMILFSDIIVEYTVLSKILLSILIVFITFSPKNLSEFLKTICIFYVSTFILAGAAFFFLYLNKNGGIVKNGVVYVFWNSKNSILVLSSFTVLIALKIIWNFVQVKNIKEKLILPMSINFDNKEVNLNALLDTGSSVCDPFTSIPVIVAEFGTIKKLLPQEIQQIFNQSKSDDLMFISKIISNSKWFRRFRLIPFNSLGNKNGMLIGFKADKIEILDKGEKKEILDVIIAIYDEFLTVNNSYSALISLDLYNNVC